MNEPHGQRASALNWATASSMPSKKGQDEDADPDQPCQPIPLVKRRLHVPVSQTPAAPRQVSMRCQGLRARCECR